MTQFVAPKDDEDEDLFKKDPWGFYSLPHNVELYPKILLEMAFLWRMPPEYLDYAPLFDRCLVKHIFPVGFYREPGNEKDWFYEGSRFLVDGKEHAKLENTSARVVLVAAGETALTQLRTNGVNLGHTCAVLRLSPFRIQVKADQGRTLHATAARAGDLIHSEDKARLLKEGKMVRKWVKVEGYTGYALGPGKGYEDDEEVNFIPKDCFPDNGPSWEDF